MYCTNCGSKADDHDVFCGVCGAPLQGNAASEPSNPSKPPVVLIAIVGVLVLVVVGLVVWGASEGRFNATSAPPSAQMPEQATAQQQDATQTKQDEAKQDAAKKAQQEAEAKKTQQEAAAARWNAIADAYEQVLDDPSPYFAGEWFGSYPNGDYGYLLTDMTGDDVPELLVSTHYSNVGSHGSGGLRFVPFVYDEQSNTVTQAQEESFSIFLEPWVSYCISADQHALVCYQRSRGQQVDYVDRVYVEDGVIKRTETDEEQGTGIAELVTSLSDRAAISELRARGGETVSASSEPSTTSEAQANATAESAAQQQHADLRSQAESQGRQVFEGVVRMVDGEELSQLDGVPINANGEKCAEGWRKSSYALLMFDDAQTVDGIQLAEDKVSRDVDHICLGEKNFDTYGGSYNRDNASQWEEYDGRRVCVSATGFSQSSGVSNVVVPSPQEVDLLYVVDE
ncbi:MAG: zinc ribbon domain-containing protein [Coriobacteriales bacterium]|nr:zinc ribbon domain-containing protein [Coriobacteriales bacterium]